MKKVLIVSHVSGFVPQFEMSNVKILQEMEYEVHYATNYNIPQYGNDNIRLEKSGILQQQVDFSRSPFRIIQNLKAFLQLKTLIKHENYAMIHCHTPIGGVLTRIALKNNKKAKVIYTAHGFHFYKGAPIMNWIIYYLIERYLARFTDVLITINEEDYKNASKFKLKPGGRVVKINGVGIEVNKFNNIYKNRINNINKILSKDIVFLSVGELNRNKNHRLVIEALYKIKRKNFVYVICGEGTQKKNLLKMIKSYQLQDQVYLLGYRRDMEKILLYADVFIMPSFREGLSVALQEAMASGLPVIATDIRGNNELIDDDLGGSLTPNNDINAMAKKLLYLYKVNRQSMGIYNINKIKKYDKKTVSAAMRIIYQNVLEEDMCWKN